MAWPVQAAAATDTWPTHEDLIEWIRRASVKVSSDTIVQEAFAAADQRIRARIDAELLTCKAADAGIETDPEAVGYDEAVLHAWCPAYVRQAIIIRAAAIYTRRDSANGTISFGEFAARVAKMDPDVDDLLSPVTLPGIA